jgi:cytochrome c oxidase assembly protein subunit 15
VWAGLLVLWQAPARIASAGRLRALALMCAALVALTILTGGFVAGTHAGLDYNSFPLMDGRVVPEGYARLQPFLRNLTENIATVQFDHRLLATLTALTATVLLVVGLAAHPPRSVRLSLVVLGVTVATQYALGVATLLLVVPVWLATAHQADAVLVLTASLVLLSALRDATAVRRRSPA